MRALAQWNTPSQVAAMLLAEYGVTINRSSVQAYDPTSVAGASLSHELKKLFESTREHFVKHETALPMSHLALRQNERWKLYQLALDKGDLKLAARMLEGATKEMQVMHYDPDTDEDGTGE